MADFFQDDDEEISSSTSSLSPRMETCPLCLGRSRYLTCEVCTRIGNFTHTKRKQSESYCEKLKRLDDLRRVKEAFQKRVIEEIERRDSLQQLSAQVMSKKERIKCLQDVTTHIQHDLVLDIEYLDSIKKTNSQKRARLKSNGEEIKRLIKEKLNYMSKLSERKDELLKLKNKLVDSRRTSMARLQKYLFPIQVVPVYPVMGTPSPSHTPNDLEVSKELGYDMEDQADASVESALAEATRTSYIHGRWVSETDTPTIELNIVDSSLPANGDYSVYSKWVKAHRSGTKGPDENVGLRNPAYTISAALTHTGQLIELIAFFFDVNLPRRLSYSEFCHNEMSRKEFKSAYTRLNTNVLHMCFSQHVDPTLLHPQRTLHNLYALINSVSTGRGGPFESHPELLSIEDEHDESNQSDFGSSTEEDMNSDEDTDWETLPKNVDIPEASLPGDAVGMSRDSKTSQSLSSQSLSSSGHESASEERGTEGSMSLVSSAAASVAALWPWKR